MYSFTEIMFRMSFVPNSVKNWSMYGSITKYENATPAKKQREENATIFEMYFRSLGRRPGWMNFQIW